uniref:Uncharacterized protein n=1 Tax=uncultured marine crenarchaeote HF4000_APKG8G15 TaxID=455605 RepID=B3TAW7_9ARCH|nr:hypothetical protein ALOHA_HF4000APKG8G15ctg1g65 [uncultured marine crenarchaeote HF4000_APKG8G15]
MASWTISFGQSAATFPFTEITGLWAESNVAAAALIAAFAVLVVFSPTR